MTTNHSITHIIEQHLDDMTELEKEIARYFLSHQLSEKELAALHVSQTLHISQAALTRFAKKCGFTGYRAFAFEYQKYQKNINTDFSHVKRDLTKRVLLDYEELTQMTHSLIDEEQLQRVAQMIENADRVYFYGKGSSGLVAREMKLRLMRLGVVCEALTENDSFAWTTSILDESCLVFGISLSAETQSVMASLRGAKNKGAKTVLLSTKKHDDFTESIAVASTHNLNYGNRISPQFPFLILLDILYAYFLEMNKSKKEAIFNHFFEE